MKPIHYAAKEGHTEVFIVLAKKTEDVDDLEESCLGLAIDNYKE